MNDLSLQPLSPLDGRYRNQVAGLNEHFSEAGLNRARVKVEIEWLIHLSQLEIFNLPRLSESEVSDLRKIYEDFSTADVAAIAEIEAITRHDVKAVEYFIRNQLDRLGMTNRAELVHFGCTSEDINNLSYALTIKDALETVWLPKARLVTKKLFGLSQKESETPMLSRTHGQPATPTTMGKELAVFLHRLNRQLKRIEHVEFLGKFSGATGTYAAHVVAKPDVDWFGVSKSFIEGLGLHHNPLTTQIESHDWQAELYQAISHFNRILHNLATDVWSYISIGYFKQHAVEGATGSSTMPHKINPIRFENAEANLELSCAVLDSLAATLVTSRLQRDLTDSSAQRNIGVGFGHSLLALDNIERGLLEISVDHAVLLADLMTNWEVLGEAIQTVIRAEVADGESTISDPYAMLKELTRGKRVDDEQMAVFINSLEISEAAKERLLLLKPQNYLGLASQLALLVSEA